MKKIQVILVFLLLLSSTMLVLSSHKPTSNDYLVVYGYTDTEGCLFGDEYAPCFERLINKYAAKGYHFVGGLSAHNKPYLVFER